MAIKLTVLAIVVAGIFAIVYRSRERREKKLSDYQLPPGTKLILQKYVHFYQQLNETDKEQFKERMRDFLSRTKITGVGEVVVRDMDIVFIAASAVIPLFSYPGWRYDNIDEILLYSDTFSKEYDIDGPDRNVLGMVGEGAMNRQMILSQPALRAGFLHPGSTHNTAIHEFVHLLDKADGAVDGVPDYMLNRETKEEWENIVKVYMHAVKEGHTDINPYGATNEAEFFAVISEYYFKQPEKLHSEYPKLYEVLKQIYRPLKEE